jgi:hypothetical protein
MMLRWWANEDVICYHAAAQIQRGLPLLDEQLGQALREPVCFLERERADEGLPAGLFWRHLVPLAAETGSPRRLADVVLTKLEGHAQAEPRIGRFERALAGVRAAFRQARPQTATAPEHSHLEMAWQRHGEALLAGVKSWTEEAVLVEEAAVFVLPPLTAGGAGAAHLPYNSVRIEVPGGEAAELPEVLRLAWLLAQLNLDLPRYSENLPVARLDLTAGLAMLPVVLCAGENLHLTPCASEAIAPAIRAWVSVGERTDELAATVTLWWDAYRAQHPACGVALSGLDRLLAGG